MLTGVPESGEKQAAQEPLPAKENEAPANEDKEQQGATTFGDGELIINQSVVAKGCCPLKT